MEFGEIDQKTELYLQSVGLKHGLLLFAIFTYYIMEEFMKGEE